MIGKQTGEEGNKRQNPLINQRPNSKKIYSGVSNIHEMGDLNDREDFEFCELKIVI